MRHGSDHFVIDRRLSETTYSSTQPQACHPVHRFFSSPPMRNTTKLPKHYWRWLRLLTARSFLLYPLRSFLRQVGRLRRRPRLTSNQFECVECPVAGGNLWFLEWWIPAIPVIPFDLSSISKVLFLHLEYPLHFSTIGYN